MLGMGMSMIDIPITRHTMLKACCTVAIGMLLLPLCNGDSVAMADDSILGDSPVIWRRGSDGWQSNVGTSVSDTDATFGVDVSVHDGTLDWGTIRDAGISFAIIRCGFGGDTEQYDDGNFLANVRGCEEAGIPYGIYLYSYACDEGDAADEACHAIRQAGRCMPSLGIWYDIEEPRQGSAIGWQPSAFADIINTFIADVSDGYDGDVPIGVYASKSYLEAYLTDASLSDVPIWMAQWAGEPTGMPDNGMMWQAGSCSVAGAEYPLDFDVHLAGSLTVGQSADAFEATDEIAALEAKLTASQDRLKTARKRLAAVVVDGYKDRNAGVALSSLLDADSISDAICMATGEDHIADSVIGIQGDIADAQAEIAELRSIIGGKDGR